MEIKRTAFLGFADAKETASLLAKNGYTIIDGGGPGIMKAATDGAHNGGGKI